MEGRTLTTEEFAKLAGCGTEDHLYRDENYLLSTHSRLGYAAIAVLTEDRIIDFFYGADVETLVPHFWDRDMADQLGCLLDVIPWSLSECASRAIGEG